MAKNHIFIAAGDACAVCEGLNGSRVEAGFRPHENCNCNTIRNEDGDEECTFDFEVTDTWKTGSRWRAALSLNITCPDGTSHPNVDQYSVDLTALEEQDSAQDELLEGDAEDWCEKLCEEEPPFLCC